MAKKKNVVPESPQEVVLTLKPGEEPEAAKLLEATGVPLVQYRVSCPNGIYLRTGPGKAYFPMTVLPYGAEVWTANPDDNLRPDRLPDDAAWVSVVTKEGTGWVDRVFLERVYD